MLWTLWVRVVYDTAGEPCGCNGLLASMSARRRGRCWARSVGRAAEGARCGMRLPQWMTQVNKYATIRLQLLWEPLTEHEPPNGSCADGGSLSTQSVVQWLSWVVEIEAEPGLFVLGAEAEGVSGRVGVHGAAAASRR
jgi:hypothetical protein